ncbi:hypothetical protein [Methylobacterium phyllostachyos]|uniref:hypothetical protein n=1 Tax=Methylobacterium phyllostachyos TaxID=582672 RepID=UPI000B898374|nr:hypothetical protein [Methylobacterium phyllostachyos]
MMIKTAVSTRISRGTGRIAEDQELTDTPAEGRRARAHLIARQLNARLAAEGLSVKARADRRAIAAAAGAEAAERRRQRDLRRRPGYAAGEASQPFEPEVRLIRVETSRTDAAADVDRPMTHLTFAEMKAQAEIYPAAPAEVHERKLMERQRRRR